MNDPIYPCIWFDGNAMEAASNYCSAFKNSTIVSSNPMVVMFEIMGKTFMGLNGGANYKPNPSISFYANCLSTNEVNSAWQNLIVDGQVLMPLDKYPWSDCYGWLQDKYGVSWQITVGQPGAKPNKMAKQKRL
jgi:predicted 3-demethylubiquinone-9 3-methyltransferase (glyoxalase superfamily)